MDEQAGHGIPEEPRALAYRRAPRRRSLERFGEPVAPPPAGRGHIPRPSGHARRHRRHLEFLASPGARHITGQVANVNGGAYKTR